MPVRFQRRFSTKLILLIGLCFLIPVVTSLAMLAATSRAGVAQLDQVLSRPEPEQHDFLSGIFPQSEHHITGFTDVITLLREYERRRGYGLFSSMTVISVALAGVVILISMLLLKRAMGSLKELSAAASQVGDGNFEVAPVSRSNDEFAQLTDAFRLMTQRLRETVVLRDYFNQVIESMPVAVFTADNDGRLRTWNRQAEELTGISAVDALGRSAEKFVEAIGRLPTPHEQLPFFGREAVIRPRAGGQRIVSKAMDALYDRGGHPVGIIGTMVDITEQKELQRQLTLAKERAEESSRLRSEFLANMSHEIRTPLNGILGLTETLIDEEGNAERRQVLTSISQCGRNLLHLINETLELSKLEAGKMVLHASTIGTRELLREASAAIEVACRKKGLQFDLQISPELSVTIEADRHKLLQVLLNLLGNAVKYTEQGFIRLTAEPYQGERLGTILFTIEDSGIGIPPDRQQQIFESFTQGENHLTRGNDGTGLGLAIARKLIALMGGEIWLASEPGRGSSFCFTIAEERGPPPS